MGKTSKTTSTKYAAVKPVFQLLYFGLFLLSLVKMMYFSVQNMIHDKGFSLTEPDSKTYGILVFIFVLLVVAHLLRVYITMKMLEKGHKKFNNFLKTDMSKLLYFFEWLLRFVIICIVTLKLLDEFSSLNDLALYLFILYFSMLSWSLLMFFGAKKTSKESYLVSSVIGTFGSIAIFIGSYNVPELGHILAVLSVFGMIIFFCYDLFKDCKANLGTYKDFMAAEILIYLSVDNNGSKRVSS